MRVLSVSFEPDAGPGVFAEAIADFGASLEEWTPPNQPPPEDPASYDAVVVCGAAANPDEGEIHPWLGSVEALLRKALAARTPLIGLCLGGQLIAQACGTPARRASRREIGWVEIEVGGAGVEDPVLGPLAPRFEAFSWHSYEFAPPAGAVELATSEVCTQACRIGANVWALQFHPEVSHADALSWIEEYSAPEAAARIRIDPAALRTETETKIDAFNQLGRDLCHRWLEVAANHPGP